MERAQLSSQASDAQDTAPTVLPSMVRVFAAKSPVKSERATTVLRANGIVFEDRLEDEGSSWPPRRVHVVYVALADEERARFVLRGVPREIPLPPPAAGLESLSGWLIFSTWFLLAVFLVVFLMLLLTRVLL